MKSNPNKRASAETICIVAALTFLFAIVAGGIAAAITWCNLYVDYWIGNRHYYRYPVEETAVCGALVGILWLFAHPFLSRGSYQIAHYVFAGIDHVYDLHGNTKWGQFSQDGQMIYGASFPVTIFFTIFMAVGLLFGFLFRTAWIE